MNGALVHTLYPVRSRDGAWYDPCITYKCTLSSNSHHSRPIGKEALKAIEQSCARMLLADEWVNPMQKVLLPKRLRFPSSHRPTVSLSIMHLFLRRFSFLCRCHTVDGTLTSYYNVFQFLLKVVNELFTRMDNFLRQLSACLFFWLL